MALLFCDGFEAMTKDELLTRWTACNDLDDPATLVQSTITRSGSNAMKIRNSAALSITKNLPEAIQTCIAGYAVYYADDTDSCNGITFRNYAYNQVTVKPESDGSITVRRGDASGTILGTSATGVILPDRWNYVEAKVHIDNSPNGSFEIRVEGSPVVSGESVDTLYSGLAVVSQIVFFSNFSNTYYDDVYIIDTLGGVNDDFLGPQRVDTLLPNGSGNYTQWNPLSGENWANVADATGDADATYVQTMSGEVTDTYTFGDLQSLSVDNIAGIQVFATARRTADTPEKLDTMCRIGSSDYSGEAKYLPIGYYGLSRVWDVNPDDSAQWEEADINGAEFGIKKIDD